MADSKCLESLSYTIVNSQKPVRQFFVEEGYLYWNNLGVSNQSGACLYHNGNPLLARTIQVYCDDICWQYAYDGVNSTITSITGNNVQADNQWAYPGHFQFSILLFQKDGSSHFLYPGVNSLSLQTPGSPIYVNVNDTVGNYGDNSGSFDMHIKIVVPYP
jgi:hypothetical protein